MEKIGKLSFAPDDNWVRRGRFGTVFAGRFNSSIKVAVKRMIKKDIQVDSGIYLASGHQNIVDYYGTGEWDNGFMWVDDLSLAFIHDVALCYHNSS